MDLLCSSCADISIESVFFEGGRVLATAGLKIDSEECIDGWMHWQDSREHLHCGANWGQPSAVTRTIGRGLFATTNIIFVFESLSTLDSTFTSAAKLLGPEFAGLLESGVPQPPQTAKIW